MCDVTRAPGAACFRSVRHTRLWTGPVWNDKLGGATGYGVRTLSGFVEAMGEK